jgi:Na+-transporting methylmalonyl-CoA/oxaloacetate decarboxylase gamma subunit
MLEDSVVVSIVGIAIVVLFVFFCFLCFDAYVVKADTVSSNKVEVSDHEDNQTVDDSVSDDAAGNDNIMETVEDFVDDETVEDNTGEDRQFNYMDSEFADSILMYLNLDYKLQLVSDILLAMLVGAAIALLVVEWFTR